MNVMEHYTDESGTTTGRGKGSAVMHGRINVKQKNKYERFG
jgi:hypothetical protein